MRELYTGQNAQSATRTYIHPATGQPTAMSTGSIGRHVQVPEWTVRRRYGKYQSSGQLNQIKRAEREVTRGGTTYTMNTVGKWRADYLGKCPDGTEHLDNY